MEKVNINGVDLELDMLDADVVEKFESLIKEVTDKIQDGKNYEGLSNADGMRFQCRTVEEFFDKLFGDGTAERVFPKNNNLGIRMEAYGKVMQLSTASTERIHEIQNKYNPNRAMNRAERRAQNKGKNRGKNRNHNFPGSAQNN